MWESQGNNFFLYFLVSNLIVKRIFYSLLIRFTDDKFDPNEQPTIGVDFKVKNLEIDGERIYLQIWDTGD